jgi:hypothetical protein
MGQEEYFIKEFRVLYKKSILLKSKIFIPCRSNHVNLLGYNLKGLTNSLVIT